MIKNRCTSDTTIKYKQTIETKMSENRVQYIIRSMKVFYLHKNIVLYAQQGIKNKILKDKSH